MKEIIYFNTGKKILFYMQMLYMYKSHYNLENISFSNHSQKIYLISYNIYIKTRIIYSSYL